MGESGAEPLWQWMDPSPAERERAEHPVTAVLRERGLLDRDGRVRGYDFAAAWGAWLTSRHDVDG